MSQLADLLAEELGQLSEFLLLLEEEQQALKQGEVSRLKEITPRKQELGSRLNETESARLQLISIRTGETPKLAMGRWLAEHPSEKSAHLCWEKLLEQAIQAKRLHEINGGLIGMHLQHTNEMLEVLGVTVSGGKTALYGSNGMAEKPSGSRIVDSA
jgi:flagella synthesis protein FlgN